ncbi:MAG: hypothetical protein V3U98_11840 [Acidobacteriota bacterium]
MIVTNSLTRHQAREASAEELARNLQSAPPEYLEGALDNSALSEEHVLEILRNPGASASLLQRIGLDMSWTRSYAVKAALVGHPSTPAAVNLHLVNFLFWRDLARVSENFRLQPQLRRAAETLLRERLQEMALGERIALARIAGRGIITGLRNETNEMVVSALLKNSRLVEEDLLLLCNKSRSPKVLGAIGRSDRWRCRPAVRLALGRNPRTPLSVSVSLLCGLIDEDLKDLSQRADLPQALRRSASGLLQERRRQRHPVGGGLA